MQSVFLGLVLGIFSNMFNLPEQKMTSSAPYKCGVAFCIEHEARGGYRTRGKGAARRGHKRITRRKY